MDHHLVKYLPRLIRSRIEGRHVLQKTIGNTGWLFADKIIRMGVGLFVGVWVARYLGPEQFGALSYALAFVALFGTLSSLGLDGIVVRELVRNPSHRDGIVGSALLLKLAGGMLLLLFSLGTIFLMRPNDLLMHWLVGIIAAGMIFQAFDAFDFWFQSSIQSKYTVYAKNGSFLIISLVKIFLILSKAPLVEFAWAGLAEVIIGSIGLIIAYHVQGFSMKSLYASRGIARGLLKDSWPLMLSGIAATIYLRIDQVMLGEMVNNKELGIYSAAVRVAEAWYFIPMVIMSSVFPSVVDSKTINDQLFYDRMQKLYNLMAFLGYLVAVPITFLGGWLISFLFGGQYIKAGPMLSLLVWAGIFTNLGVARSSFLLTMNWQRAHAFTVFFGCILNVILNYILIPLYGGMGAVIASCLAYWFAAHGACFFYKPLYKTGWMLTKALIYPKVW